MDRCEECGFVYADYFSSGVVAELAALGGPYRKRLTGAIDDGRVIQRETLTRRPASDVWSVLEYACHVRDVLLAQRERLFLALVEDRPSFRPIYRDFRAKQARYNDDDPGRVADEIALAARLIARSFGGLDVEGWARPCIYNYPEPAERTLQWLAQHTLHEGVHHLFDIDRILDSMASQQ